MAEPESILQLGIEAARDGNKEEARNLFRLLTRQEPQNAQAWLWLAGVAENRDERQAALERVVELDPGNEMAVKGLQALGVRPASRHDLRAAEPSPSAAAEEPEFTLPPPPAPAPSPYADIDEDDPFAQLDALSDVIAEGPSAARRNEPPPDVDTAEDRVGAARPSSIRTESPLRTTSTIRSTRAMDSDDDETEPARGINPLLLFLLGLATIGLIAALAWYFFFDNPPVITGPSPQQQTAIAQATLTGSQPSPAVTGEPGGAPMTGTDTIGTTEPITGTNPLTTTGPAADATPGAATPAPGAPTAAPPATPTSDLTAANPTLLPPNTPIESGGWLYDFPRANYAAPVIGNLGAFQPQGRFVVVLIHAENRTGQIQPIPPDFFVLKDARGRVYQTRPEVSAAYVIPGVNADVNQQQPMPPDGLYRSVAIIFDVVPDASNLVLFSRSDTSQGWLVLPQL